MDLMVGRKEDLIDNLKNSIDLCLKCVSYETI